MFIVRYLSHNGRTSLWTIVCERCGKEWSEVQGNWLPAEMSHHEYFHRHQSGNS